MKTYRFIVVVTASALLCTAGHGEEKKVEPDPVLLKLRDTIKQELVNLDPKPTFEFHNISAGGSLVVRYKTRQYVIHPRKNKSGHFSEETASREGPSGDGLLLRAHIQPFGQVNQAEVPQTTHRPYWSVYLQVYELEKEEKQIFFVLSYNSGTDPELIKTLKQIAEQFGTPSSPNASPSIKR